MRRSLGDAAAEVALPISPLQLDSLTRDYYGAYDAYAASQLAPLASLNCYQPKFYVAPALPQQVMDPGQTVPTGLQMRPRSLVFGFYCPALFATLQAPRFVVQVKDPNFKNRAWWDQPIPSYFLANLKPTYLSAYDNTIGSFPSLLTFPYPITGSGLLSVEIRCTSAAQQRVQLVFGVLEECQ